MRNIDDNMTGTGSLILSIRYKSISVYYYYDGVAHKICFLWILLTETSDDRTVIRIIIGSVLGAVAALLVIVGVLVAVLVYCCHKRSMNIVEKKDRQVYCTIRYYVINRLLHKSQV